MSAHRYSFKPASPGQVPEEETSTLVRHLWRAWRAGDHKLAKAWNLHSSAARATLKSSLQRAKTPLPMARLNEVATLAVADALSSKDTALLDLVRGVETADPLCDRYLRLLMSEQPPAKPTRPIAKGHVHSWAALQRTLLRADAARIAALVTTPDHHDFARFSGWIPAVAWALTSGLPADRRAHALWGWVSEGGRPDGLDVLFERQREKPSFEARKSASWWGFDAVARRNNELLVYYYMGVRWRAPLVFENGLNAFWFLDHIDTAWEELLQDLSEDDIYWAERAREDGRVRHIVVHDATISATSEETLRRVSDHYGIAVEAADLMRV